MWQGGSRWGALLAVCLGLVACGQGRDGGGVAEIEERPLTLAVGARAEGYAGATVVAGEAVRVEDGGVLLAVRPGEATVRTEATAGAVRWRVQVPEPDTLTLALEPAGDVLRVGERRTVRLWAVTGEVRHDVGPWARWSVAGAAGWDAATRTVQPTAEGEVTIQAEWLGRRPLELTVAVQPADPVVGYRLDAAWDAPWPAGITRTAVLRAVRESGGEAPLPDDFDGARLATRGPLSMAWQAPEVSLTPTGEGTGCLTLDGQDLACWSFAAPVPVALEAALVGPAAPAVGETLTLRAQRTDSLGERRDASGEVQWVFDPAFLAATGEAGVLRVLAAGATTVVARQGDLESAPLALELHPPRLRALRLSGAPAVILPGERVALTVIGDYTDGERPIADPAWEIEDESVLAVAADGLRALAAGVTRVWARKDGVRSDSLELRVAGTVALDPVELDLTAGETGVISAHVGPVDVSGRVLWQSEDPEVAAVDQGRVLALTPGTVAVTTDPPASQPAQVAVRPRPVLNGLGTHLLTAADFARDPNGKLVAALRLDGLAAGGLYTVRVDALPLGTQMILYPDPDDGRLCTNAGPAGPLGCSLRTNAGGALVVLLVVSDPSFDPSGRSLAVRDGGFEDEGDPVSPVSLTLGAPRVGTVTSGGISHYRIALDGAGRYRLTVDNVEGGPAPLGLGGQSGCSATLLTAGDVFTCDFQPDQTGPTRVDLVIGDGITPAPEGGTRYRLLIEPRGTP